MTRQEIEGEEEIGPLLKRLRRDHSLSDVQRLTGSHLSLIERGDRNPGVNLLNKLAILYGVDPNELLHRARRLGSGNRVRRPMLMNCPAQADRDLCGPLHPDYPLPTYKICNPNPLGGRRCEEKKMSRAASGRSSRPPTSR